MGRVVGRIARVDYLLAVGVEVFKADISARQVARRGGMPDEAAAPAVIKIRHLAVRAMRLLRPDIVAGFGEKRPADADRRTGAVRDRARNGTGEPRSGNRPAVVLAAA